MTADEAQQILDTAAAPYVRALGLALLAHEGQSVTLRMPVTPQVVHGGGVVCGQALMAAADTAMVIALSAALGGFRPMTTAQLGTSFLRPVPGDAPELRVVATVLRIGRTLAYGEIAISTPDGRLAVHATTTYALL